MAILRPLPPFDERPESLGDRAASDLRFIRSTMERSGRFTAVPGWGGVFMGAVGLLAASVSSFTTTPDAWILTWLMAAGVAISGGGLALGRKATQQDQPLGRGHGRMFVLGLCPPILAGAVLTIVLHRAELTHLLPSVWLLLYGAAVLAGGAYSVLTVSLTGVVFMLLGIVAAFAPATWGTPLLAVGFGGVHCVSGILIARSHGG